MPCSSPPARSRCGSPAETGGPALPRRGRWRHGDGRADHRRTSAAVARDQPARSRGFALTDGRIDDDHRRRRPGGRARPGSADYRITRGQLIAQRCARRFAEFTSVERLAIFLPLLMWVVGRAGQLVSCVSRLLIRPLRRLERAVERLQPGESDAGACPNNFGPADEIRDRSATPSPARSSGSNSPNSKWPKRSTASGGWCAKSITG